MRPCPFCGSSRVEIYRCKNGDARVRCECGAVWPAGHGSYFAECADAARQVWDERAMETRGHVSSRDLEEVEVRT
jgi:hypothetical protein